MKEIRIGFIGAGRVGVPLAWALTDSGYQVVEVFSRRIDSSHKLVSRIPGCHIANDPQIVLNNSDLIFLTVPDGVLVPLLATLNWDGVNSIVHCSGASELSVLDFAASKGVNVGSFHPMQIFADHDVALSNIKKGGIALEANEPLLGQLTEIVDALGAYYFSIKPGSRTIYHVGCNFAGPLIASLLKEASLIFENIGVNDEDSLRALLALSRSALDAIEKSGLHKGMSGPISRGDIETVQKHTRVLFDHDKNVMDLYCRLAMRAIPLALKSGTITSDHAEKFESLLINMLKEKDDLAS